MTLLILYLSMLIMEICFHIKPWLIPRCTAWHLFIENCCVLLHITANYKVGFERNPLNYKANALLLCCSHRPVAKELADSKVKLSSYAILNNWNWFEVNLSSSNFCRRCRQVKSGQLKIKLRGQSESYTLSVSPSLSPSLSLSLSQTHTPSLSFSLSFSLSVTQ